MLDTFGHLARTQALLIYQLIRLYDGDIQARARAEEDMSTLDEWAKQMWESARLDVAAARAEPWDFNISPLEGGGLNAFRVDRTAASLWHAWILAESVHRTYVLASYVQQIYVTLKQGWAACPGSVPFTMQLGLWDSPSAYSWFQACKRSNHKLFTSFIHSDDLFAGSCPDEIDEFAIAALVAAHGMDRMDEWAAEKGGSFITNIQRTSQSKQPMVSASTVGGWTCDGAP